MSTRELLRANDARFCALAAGFSAEEWSQPSLCDGWSNHDVLAHLVVGYCSETTSPTSSTCFFALGREPAIPADVLIAVLNTQVSVPNPFVPAYRNSRGLRLIATDADWTHGERGPLVRGRAADLVSVLGNRSAMLARLGGDGVDVLASSVSRHLIRRAG